MISCISSASPSGGSGVRSRVLTVLGVCDERVLVAVRRDSAARDGCCCPARGVTNAGDERVDGVADDLSHAVADLPVLLCRCDEGALLPLAFLYHLRAIAATIYLLEKRFGYLVMLKDSR